MTQFTASVAAGSDDAQETNGTMALTGTTLNANSANQTSGMRFLNVTVPPGSTVTAAALALNLVSATYDDPDVTISAEAAANAAAFTSTTDDIADRVKTTAVVTWNAGNVGAGSRNTPDLAALAQEVIDLPGWASGHAIVFFIRGNNTNSTLRWSAFEDSEPQAALTITYTPPGSGQPARTMHQVQMS